MMGKVKNLLRGQPLGSAFQIVAIPNPPLSIFSLRSKSFAPSGDELLFIRREKNSALRRFDVIICPEESFQLQDNIHRVCQAIRNDGICPTK